MISVRFCSLKWTEFNADLNRTKCYPLAYETEEICDP
jgi:hypothetical protein